MKRFSILLILILTAWLYGCNILSQNSKSKAPPPDWVKTKPVSAMYYTGIGSASKIGFAPADYTQTAQQQALGDLSREISVNISSASVLSIMENNYNINSNWSSEIKASSDMFLEGYELVETWENKEYYWVYYRLSKEKHASLKSQRKNQAINEALLKFNEGKKQHVNNALFEAFSFYADALSVLKPYMAESTETEIDGVKTDIAQEVFTAMIGIVQSVQINFIKTDITVKRGIPVPAEYKTFYVVNAQNQPLSNIPVEFSLSTSGLIQNRYVSDNLGRVVCDINKINSSNKNETLSVWPDMQTWSRLTKDPLVRNIIRQIPVSKKLVLLHVEKPNFFISSVEKNFNQIVEQTMLRDAMQGALAAENGIVHSIEDADFSIYIESNSVKKPKTHYNEEASVEMTISVKDSKSDLIYQKMFTADGEGNDAAEATREAYKEASNIITRRVSKEIAGQLFAN